MKYFQIMNYFIVSWVSLASASPMPSFNLLFPGTKWCGKGDVAENDHDLGWFEQTDECCRDHDKCPNYVAGGETKFGLHNEGSITIAECKCDEDFRECLGDAEESFMSFIMESSYFDLLPRRCFNLVPGNNGTQKGELEKNLPFQEVIQKFLDILPSDNSVVEVISDSIDGLADMVLSGQEVSS
ncbi:phospholipase A2 large subunit [Diachasma alloeum]|uniref:phospholipase A2 large subunit n=1 Tax=Diachasma alloeum TaxID=454923 RepID=UPI0007383E98|nr:phospholipase A2 large subunit [Diachasma alloeum]